MRVFPERVWRVFPWDPRVTEGEPHSPSYRPQGPSRGRFDLSGVPGGSIYLSETPEHAVAEIIQRYRGQSLDQNDLRVAGHSLALVPFDIPEEIHTGVANLCDAELLVRHGIDPDKTASFDRSTTQRIADKLNAAGYSGLRWWSTFSGDWHTIVLFRDRPGFAQDYGVPEPLTISSPVVRDAARMLDITVKSTAS